MIRTYQDNEGPVHIEIIEPEELVCPQCGSAQLEYCEWCGTRCRETGYSDIGEQYRCKRCGEKGNPDELMTRERFDQLEAQQVKRVQAARALAIIGERRA
jgi:hypothetical protein